MILIGLFCSSTIYVRAQPLTRWTHFGTRPLALGNAYTAIADDYNALFYNPAGLARVSSIKWELIHPTIGISKNAISTINSKEFKDLQKSKNSTDDYLTFFQQQAGKPFFAQLSLCPYIIGPNWGLGIGAEFSLDMTSHSGLNIDTDLNMTVTLPIGFATNFLDKQLSVGISLKGILTSLIDQEISIDSLSTLSSAEKRDEIVFGGVGPGIDLGILYTPNIPMEPTLGISLINVGGIKLTKVGGFIKKTHQIEASLNTGISIKPYKKDSHYFLLSLDTHSINQSSHYSKKFNIGAEISFWNWLKFQTGLMGGLISGGLQVDLRFFKLRLATYSIEHSPAIGVIKSGIERRYLIDTLILL